LLKLGRDADEDRLTRRWSRQLHPDWQPFAVPPEGKRDGRLSRHVEDGSEGGEFEALFNHLGRGEALGGADTERRLG
jgi:hypothetical protein